jgi:glycosyltransferase involved in cell wall biosynthesis
VAETFAIIIPACNEAPCLGAVLDELRATIGTLPCEIVVGVNGSSDATANVAREHGALAAETAHRGYGFGCLAAIELVKKVRPEVEAFIFFAGDGANDPSDIAALIAAYRTRCTFVLGSRTNRRDNWPVMGLRHVLANRLLAAWCSCLTGRFFHDIGPLRLISARLFDAMQLQEVVYGWTIEAQIRAVQLGASICEIPVQERRRIGGVQKVSRVSWTHSLHIGAEIFCAGWRTRFRQARYARSAALAAR